MTDLPNKLSDILTIALEDLDRVEADPTYSVDMGNWHYNNTDNGRCEVCLAGAVMAKTLGVSSNKTRGPEYTSCDAKLRAIDSARKGLVHVALHLCGVDYTKVRIMDRHVVSYGHIWFKMQMQTIIAELRLEGL